MIVIRGAAADAIREARCTNCWPESINEGVLCIPEGITLDDDDGGIDDFVAVLIETMQHPVSDRQGRWFPQENDL